MIHMTMITIATTGTTKRLARRPASSRLGCVLLVGLAGLLAAAMIFRCGFFVDETEYVYVTQFGEPVRFCPQAGLQLKWPYQSLWRFDRRLQLYEPPAREMLTEDKENLNFDWYVCWRLPSLSSPSPSVGKRSHEQLAAYVRRFLQTVGDPATAENRLEERIQAALAAEIGHTKLDQLVTLKPGGLELDALAQRVRRRFARGARAIRHRSSRRAVEAVQLSRSGQTGRVRRNS